MMLLRTLTVLVLICSRDAKLYLLETEGKILLNYSLYVDISHHSLVKGRPSIEREFSFKAALDTLESHNVASFTISDDLIYVVSGGDIGNAIIKFDLEGHFLERYPGWFNFPDDILIGGERQALVSALGAMGEVEEPLRFGFVVYDSQGNFLNGLHQKQVG